MSKKDDVFEDELRLPMKTSIVVITICVFLMGVSFMMPRLFTMSVRGDYLAMKADVAKKENNLVALKRESDKVEQQLFYDVTGISNQKIVEDSSVASDFFKPAFTWTSGDEYDATRQMFIELLGENNRFVKEYLVENTKVDDFNKIDVNELKMSMDTLTAYPSKLIDDDTYEYLGFIKYYPYKDASDLKVKDKLTASTAIVQYTVSSKDGEPTVTNISAWNGM